jgi:hypothetical protein
MDFVKLMPCLTSKRLIRPSQQRLCWIWTDRCLPQHDKLIGPPLQLSYAPNVGPLRIQAMMLALRQVAVLQIFPLGRDFPASIVY